MHSVEYDWARSLLARVGPIAFHRSQKGNPMDDIRLIPAAQYLRMSTEHQQYSLVVQESAIKRYAEEHGFTVVRTYSDGARSGLVLKNRAGLRELLEEVVGKD